MTPLAARVLSSAGYVTEAGEPVDGLVLPAGHSRGIGDVARLNPLLSNARTGLGADAVFRVGTSPVIVFKSSPVPTTDNDEAEWHRLAWNFGVAPLLWITTPQYIRLYNAYQPPADYERQSPKLAEFPLDAALDRALTDITATCGRRHVVMGSFWQSGLASRIDRRGRVDNVLLCELMHLLGRLVEEGVPGSLAQKIVGRCIFFQYLVHRGYVTDEELAQRFGAPRLNEILTNLDWTYNLFQWIRKTFNGDLFPVEDEKAERKQLGNDARPLEPLSDFFGYFNISDRQGRLFPFRFDAIPVELISSIYEKFVHMSETDGEPVRGVHYTPINVVDLMLDPIFEGLAPTARILDLACGSGVFLVESLRRLVWLRAQAEPLTRELIRDVLMRQVRGVDISRAALSVAAFSLYLALLELDPNPPRGLDALDCLRFDPLEGHVLYPTSAFSPHLATRMAVNHDQLRYQFDAIVGNPPWTYSAEEKEEDRFLADEQRLRVQDGETADTNVEEDADDDDIVQAASDDPERRSGTTYSRLRQRPIPPRSMDWPFLWRCCDFCHDATRIALVMKATPFFSLDRKTSSARDVLLRSFPSVGVVNLSQLRTSRLFQEYADEDKGERRKKRSSGPALLFFSNCLPSESGTVTGVNFPWTPDFQRTGIFELSPEPAKLVSLDELRREPALLKSALFGTERDVWFLERLARNADAVRLVDWWRDLNLAAGQGYQPGTGMASAHLKGLRKVTASNFRLPKLPARLPRLQDDTVHRARNPEIYCGPLVLLPEGKLTAAAAPGRYAAVFDSRDLAFNESFVGVSFKGRDPVLARAFAAVMSSALVAYQIAFQGGTVGIKQTKVEAVDLENLRIPRLERLHARTLAALAETADTLAPDAEPSATKSALADIDSILAAALHLNYADRALLADSRRIRAVLFETSSARLPMERPPTIEEVKTYARNLCTVFNAFATEDEDQVLVADRYASPADDVVIVKFLLIPRAREKTFELRRGGIGELGDRVLSELGGAELPYLKAGKSLRIYLDSEVYILKPAHYRCFSPAAGQSDGDRIIGDLMQTISLPSSPQVLSRAHSATNLLKRRNLSRAPSIGSDRRFFDASC